MNITFFTDLIDALGKATRGLKAIVNLPNAWREAMLDTLDETYRLVDTTLNRRSFGLATSCGPLVHHGTCRRSRNRVRRKTVDTSGCAWPRQNKRPCARNTNFTGKRNRTSEFVERVKRLE